MHPPHSLAAFINRGERCLADLQATPNSPPQASPHTLYKIFGWQVLYYTLYNKVIIFEFPPANSSKGKSYMKLIKKVLAICFLLFGIPFSAVMILEIMNPKTPAQEKENFKYIHR